MNYIVIPAFNPMVFTTITGLAGIFAVMVHISNDAHT